MSEYRITYTEIPNPRSDNETHDGVLLHIQPPIQLNPDAVERYLTDGDLEPVNRNYTNADIRDVVVLGSTAEQTTVYASISKYAHEEIAKESAHHTVELLRFMGARAIIDNPPTPDA